VLISDFLGIEPAFGQVRFFRGACAATGSFSIGSWIGNGAVHSGQQIAELGQCFDRSEFAAESPTDRVALEIPGYVFANVSHGFAFVPTKGIDQQFRMPVEHIGHGPLVWVEARF
jgi:hypothetical protein